MNALEELIATLTRLPAIGRKSATRMAYYLLSADPSYTNQLAHQIESLHTRIRCCDVCGNYTDEERCSVCRDPKRDGALICVVEHSQDVVPILRTNAYAGVFHVLHGVISPLNGVGPDALAIPQLIERIRQGGVREVIIATNPTVEGDTTALYLVEELRKYSLSVTRLAAGIPVGGDLEYADRLTLARSLQARRELER